MSELAAFLSARLDEDEAMAHAAGEDGAASPCEKCSSWTGGDGGYDGGGEVRDGHGNPVVYNEGSPNTAQALHIALHDPARVLREVAAARKLIAFAFANGAEIDGEFGDGHEAEGQCGGYGAQAVRDVLVLLGVRWSDHPDYDPSWAPVTAEGSPS